MLEIGCGTGTLTAFLVDRELVVTVDVVEEYIRVVRERFHDRPNVHVRLLDVTQSLGDLPQFGFDSALSVNVVEHIEDDVKAMQSVHWLMGPFDRAIGHYRRYTKPALRGKLEAAGFVVEHLRRSNPIGAVGWFVNTVALRRRALGTTRVYDRLVPLNRLSFKPRSRQHQLGGDAPIRPVR